MVHAAAEFGLAGGQLPSPGRPTKWPAGYTGHPLSYIEGCKGDHYLMWSQFVGAKDVKEVYVIPVRI